MTNEKQGPQGAGGGQVNVNVVGMPEFDELMDHIYEYGTASEGVIERANAFARAVIARYAPQQPASVDEVKEPDLWRCTVCRRVGTVGRCCGEETRERVNVEQLLDEYERLRDEVERLRSADDEVVFIDGVGASRSSIKSCHGGVQWIGVGGRVYWPLSESDAKRLQSACCGNGSFDGPTTSTKGEQHNRYDRFLDALEELRRKQRAVKHWNNLADDVERRADLGLLDTNVAKERADCYRRTARAIQHDIDALVALSKE